MEEDEPKVTQEEVGIKKIMVDGYEVLLDGDYDGEYISTHFYLRVFTPFIHRDLGKPGKFYAPYVYASPRGVSHVKFNSPRRTTLARLLLGTPPIEIIKPFASYRDGNTLNLTTTNLYWRSSSDSAKARDNSAYVGIKRPRTAHPELAQWHGIHNGSSRGKFDAVCAGTYLGHFDTPEEAARAYDEYAYSLYGKKAHLNYPSDYGLPPKRPEQAGLPAKADPM